MSEASYRVHEFAQRAGVTVRALHHYDHLGLLKASVYSEAGYRLYGDRDLARLEQIVMLKFIGFPLKQIRELLAGNGDLPGALRLQRSMLSDKRRHLELAIRAIDKAETMLASGGQPDWDTFRKIIEVIHMQSNKDWMRKYYTEDQLTQLGERYSTEVQEQASRDWAELIKDVQASLGEDPAGEKAQALAERWSELIARFTGGDPGIEQNLSKLYADKANWPSTFKKPYSDEVGDFIHKAMALHKQAK